ncbi:hypothetical protein D082_01270 [Synechocystis sp. PCC 6714]|nr:hypothetical protein D082_01270 [Synechocystis sp. PCC 6714]
MAIACKPLVIFALLSVCPKHISIKYRLHGKPGFSPGRLSYPSKNFCYNPLDKLPFAIG